MIRVASEMLDPGSVPARFTPKQFGRAAPIRTEVLALLDLVHLQGHCNSVSSTSTQRSVDADARRHNDERDSGDVGNYGDAQFLVRRRSMLLLTSGCSSRIDSVCACI